MRRRDFLGSLAMMSVAAAARAQSRPARGMGTYPMPGRMAPLPPALTPGAAPSKSNDALVAASHAERERSCGAAAGVARSRRSNGAVVLQQRVPRSHHPSR